jgi:RNA polymerase sigma-70 factor (ECF subfamily)
VLAELSRRELAGLTREAMSRLDEAYRVVLSLRIYEGLPHAEVAGVIGCTETNARAKFFWAKRSL